MFTKTLGQHDRSDAPCWQAGVAKPCTCLPNTSTMLSSRSAYQCWLHKSVQLLWESCTHPVRSPERCNTGCCWRHLRYTDLHHIRFCVKEANAQAWHGAQHHQVKTISATLIHCCGHNCSTLASMTLQHLEHQYLLVGRSPWF